MSVALLARVPLRSSLLLLPVLLVAGSGACSGRQTSNGPDSGGAGAATGHAVGGVGGVAGDVNTRAGSGADAFLPCPTAVPTDGDHCFLGAGVPSGERCTYEVPGCPRLTAVCSMNTWRLEACAGSGGTGPGPSPCIPSCAAGERCVTGNWLCDGRYASVCHQIDDCEPRVSTVCGCNGQVYESDCAAYEAGTSLNGYTPFCAAPAGTFPCGYSFCALGELCVEHYEAGWSCQPLPEVCQGEPDCDCLAGAGGAGGEGGSASPDWSSIAGDSRCQECTDDGPGLKVFCSVF